MKLVVTRRAKRDQNAISRYTLERWGRPQLLTYVGGLIDRMDQIAEKPTLGRTVSGIPIRYRRVPYGSHFIFYTVHEHHVRIVRIVHQRMDAARHLN